MNIPKGWLAWSDKKWDEFMLPAPNGCCVERDGRIFAEGCGCSKIGAFFVSTENAAGQTLDEWWSKRTALATAHEVAPAGSRVVTPLEQELASNTQRLRKIRPPWRIIIEDLSFRVGGERAVRIFYETKDNLDPAAKWRRDESITIEVFLKHGDKIFRIGEPVPDIIGFSPLVPDKRVVIEALKSLKFVDGE